MIFPWGIKIPALPEIKSNLSISILRHWGLIITNMRKITLVVLFAFLIIGCAKENKVELIPESFTENELTDCRNAICSQITINYIRYFGDNDVADKINSKIEDYIIHALVLEEDSIPNIKSIAAAAKNFNDSYQRDKNQFPDMAGEYFAEVTVADLYFSEEILSFELRKNLYTGGAHGYSATEFINFDPKTGDVISTKNLIKDDNGFLALAEKKFRQQHNIPADQSINESGYWFENDTFNLPESIGFTTDTLIFIYNQYEIASFAEGPIELKIPKKEVTPFLKLE